MVQNAGMAYSIAIAKAITSILLTITFVRLYFKKFNTSGESEYVSYYQLFRPFFLMILVILYTVFMNNVDSLGKQAESYVYSSFNSDASVTKLIADLKPASTQATPAPVSKKNVIAKTADAMTTIADYFEHPSLIMVKCMDAFAKMVDFFIYTFVIVVRFAFLFVLRFIGPIVIALSIFERFEDWWVRWIAAYGWLYIWVITIFLINFFCLTVAHGVYKIIVAGSDSLSETVAGLSYTSTIITLVVVKIYLYSKSKAILQKIFTA
jgi:hypothetical protein